MSEETFICARDEVIADASAELSQLNLDITSTRIQTLREAVKQQGLAIVPHITKPLLVALLKLAELVVLSKEYAALSELALRCTMNVLYMDTSLSLLAIFISLHGPSQLFDTLQQEIPIRIANIAVKTLYLIFSIDKEHALLVLSLRSKLALINFSEVIVATFTHSLKPSMDADRRELFVDCSKLLYAVELTYQKAIGGSGDFEISELPGLQNIEKTLHSVQSVVVEVMLLSSRNRDVYLCQLACLQLMLLADSKAITKLCEVPMLIGAYT